MRLDDQPIRQATTMSRRFSFAVLVGVVLLVGWLFAMVMAQFLLPMFLAVLLTILFRPLHVWFFLKTRGSSRIAALLTTLSIIAIVLTPLFLVMSKAAAEGWQLAREFNQDRFREAVIDRGGELIDRAQESFKKVGIELPSRDEIVRTASNSIRDWLAPAALRTTQFVGNLAFTLAIMVVCLYFFLADGPAMVRGIVRLVPVDTAHQEKLLEEFGTVSRAVVTATLLGTLGQGLLAGIGYFAAGLPGVFLLMVMTMVLSFIPVVGAAAVWGGAALWLYLGEDRAVAAVLLALWGAGVVAMADNIIKPIVLQGQSNIHPLLALLSVLGGVNALGLIGIFVGPMVVAFLQALLNMLRTELDSMDPRHAAAS